MYSCVLAHACVLDTLKLQFVESGVPEALSEMIRTLQGGSDTHDLCSIKVASNLIVTLLLGGTSLSMITLSLWEFILQARHLLNVTLYHNTSQFSEIELNK